MDSNYAILISLKFFEAVNDVCKSIFQQIQILLTIKYVFQFLFSVSPNKKTVDPRLEKHRRMVEELAHIPIINILIIIQKNIELVYLVIPPIIDTNSLEQLMKKLPLMILTYFFHFLIA